MIFAGGSSPASGTTPAGPRISLTVCAKAPDVHKANAIATRGNAHSFHGKSSKIAVVRG